MNRRSGLIVFFLALAAFTIGLPALTGWLADWYWFSAIGFQSVYTQELRTRLLLGLGTGVISWAVIYGNLTFALRGATLPMMIGVKGEEQRVDVTRIARGLSKPVPIVIGLIAGLAGSALWLTVLRFLHATPFGTLDPIFQRDLSWYTFTLPLLSSSLTFVRAIAILSLGLTAPLYLLRGDVVARRQRVIVEPSAQLHLGILVAVLFLTTALQILFVRIPSLLYSTTGDRFVGASYADLHAQLPLLRTLAFVAFLGAIASTAGALRSTVVRYAGISVAAYAAVALLTVFVPNLVHQFVVLPNELARETPQLQHHIAATRRAWSLDSVTEKELNGEAALTLKDIRANAATIENVRLWDRDPLLRTFGQLQEIRTYYDFVSVDDDRYRIDGRYRQVLLSPRELNTTSLPTRNFINERLTFTHGMGLTLSPVNQVTDEGLPMLFLKDLPPASTVSIAVKQPAIYYGELTNDYVFAGSGQQEFDYPSAEGDVYVHYAGTGGVPVSSFFRRVVLSLYFGSTNILFSKDITASTQALYHRNVRERARTALPFIQWDADPYIVIRADGRLTWIMDGYTVTDRYPYAITLENGVNYMRNSVKLAIDAYDGSLTAWISAPDDPLVQTYAKMFPGILQPLSTMPEDLRSHIRFPEDLFAIQASLYATYHMDEPSVFFHREDQWQMPAAGKDNSSRAYLRHTIMKLPGESTEEYIEMTPFTPRGKDNLAAWMIVRNDGPHYGQLAVYRFPRQSLVFGPTQIQNRINQNTDISQQLTLWDQRGSTVIRGNLLVIPIEESLIFVQALYLQAEGGRIPELKRVIVAYRNDVVMEETLEQGLARIFGGATGSAPARPQATEGPPVAGAAGGSERTAALAALAREASQHYDRAITAQRGGDWTTYGTEMRLVGDVLRRMRQ